MTYREVYEKAEWKLERGEITFGEFDELTKSLDEEIRPHGEWEYCGGIFCARCSVCKEIAYEMAGNFCPNCGADMREGEAE